MGLVVNVADVSFAAVSCVLLLWEGVRTIRTIETQDEHVNTGNKIAGRRGID